MDRRENATVIKIATALFFMAVVAVLFVSLAVVLRVWCSRLCPRCGGIMRWESFPRNGGVTKRLYCRGCSWRAKT